jgi:peptidoglycan/LPS O-acetylase OafA/YrhL
VTRRLFELAVRCARFGAVLSLTITVIGVLLPGYDLPKHLPPDYLLHGFGFGAPALFAAFAARNRRNVSAWAVAIAVIALASELAQYFVPDRTVSAHDLAANVIGIAIGSTIGLLLYSVLAGLVPATRGS